MALFYEFLMTSVLTSPSCVLTSPSCALLLVGSTSSLMHNGSDMRVYAETIHTHIHNHNMNFKE